MAFNPARPDPVGSSAGSVRGAGRGAPALAAAVACLAGVVTLAWLAGYWLGGKPDPALARAPQAEGSPSAPRPVAEASPPAAETVASAVPGPSPPAGVSGNPPAALGPLGPPDALAPGEWLAAVDPLETARATPAFRSAPDARPPPAAVAPAAVAPPPGDPVAVLPPGRLPAWRRNAATMPPRAVEGEATGRIAIVIDDLGMNWRRTRAAIALPGPLTLSYLPYAERVETLVGEGRSRGHEILVHVPMEPLDAAIYPGPGALRVAHGTDELRRRLASQLDRFPGHVGLNNHMGSRFTQDVRAMDVVMAELRARGLLFVDSRTVAGTIGGDRAAAFGVPWIGRDVFLDNDRAAGAVEAQLDQVERIARRRGHAVAIGHPHDATLRALRDWLPTLARKGLSLVPVSAVVSAGAGEGPRHADAGGPERR